MATLPDDLLALLSTAESDFQIAVTADTHHQDDLTALQKATDEAATSAQVAADAHKTAATSANAALDALKKHFGISTNAPTGTT